MNSACVPTMVEDINGDGRWISMHNRFVSQAKETEPDVVFIGDSLIANLQFTDLWEKWFVPMHTLNFGIGADQTQNVLWRLKNGEMECMRPKAIVVLIGTNNHTHTAEEVAEAIVEIYSTIREKQPEAFIIFLSILPRGEGMNPLREKITSINSSISKSLDIFNQCQVLSIGEDLVLPDGTIDHRDMYDYLHLTWQGYRKAFRPVYDLLLSLLQEEDADVLNNLGAQGTTPSPSTENIVELLE